MRFGATMVIGQPRLMHHSIPGEIRSFTLSTSFGPILSPGTTSALATPALNASSIAALATARHQPGLLAIVLSSWAGLGGRNGYLPEGSLQWCGILGQWARGPRRLTRRPGPRR